jgi:hypothetical protein
MHPFRIAILAFVVGASVANYFAAKAYSDRIREPFAFSASTAGPVDLLSPGPSPNDEATPFRWMPLAADPQTLKLLAVENDKAWMREAIIVTIAGVAWFLVRPKASPS